jgi:hypothetical protein
MHPVESLLHTPLNYFLLSIILSSSFNSGFGCLCTRIASGTFYRCCLPAYLVTSWAAYRGRLP